MGRRLVEVPVPALALRRAEAAAALGVSVETFDQHVRPFIPAVRLGSVIIYTTTDLQAFLDAQADSPLPHRKDSR